MNDFEGTTVENLVELPSFVITEIFSYLSGQDLAQCSMTCTTFEPTANDKFLWRDLYSYSTTNIEEKFDVKKPDENWKIIYIEQAIMNKSEKRYKINNDVILFSEVEEQIKNLPKLIENIYSEDPKTQLKSTIILRKIVSIEENPPIQEVINTGVLPRLVEFLKFENNTNLKYEVIWIIINISFGNLKETNTVIDTGVIPVLVELLNTSEDTLKYQIIWALGNIATENSDSANHVLKYNIIDPLLKIFKSSPTIYILRNCLWLLYNICKVRPVPSWQTMKPILDVISKLILLNKDEEIITVSCWSISNYFSSNEDIQKVLELNLVPRLIQLLKHHSEILKEKVLAIIDCIVAGTDIQTQIIINAGFLNFVPELLNSNSPVTKAATCFTLSNITAGTNIDLVILESILIDSNIIPTLINLTKTQFSIAKEAIWALSNATLGSIQQIKHLIKQGIIKTFCDLLDITDTQIIPVVLLGIENILRILQSEDTIVKTEQNFGVQLIKDFGGLQKIQNLVGNIDTRINDKASEIVELYFNN